MDGPAKAAPFKPLVDAAVAPAVAQAEAARDAAVAALAGLAAVTTSTTRNRFNAATKVVGYIVNTAGAVVAESVNPATGSVASGLIACRKFGKITFSGLPNLGNRVLAFYGADGTTKVGDHVTILGTTAQGTYDVPAAAYFCRLTLSYQSGTANTFATVQAEKGAVATAYVAFEGKLVAAIGGRAIDVPDIPAIGYIGAGKNLFDKLKVTEGKGLFFDGSLETDASDSVCELIYVGHLQGQSIHLSGLQPPTINYSRPYAFYSTAEIAIGNVIATGNVSYTVTAKTIDVPAGAMWFAFNPRMRNGNAPAYDALQLEVGTAASAYQAFIAGPGLIDGRAVRAPGAATSAEIPKIGFVGGGKNLFNAATVIEGKGLNFDGYSIETDTGNSMSAPIYVGHLQGRTLYLSGLQPKTVNYNRPYSFFSSSTMDAASLVSTNTVHNAVTAKAIAVPTGAKWLVFNPRMHNSNAPSYGALQLELGDTATAFEAYLPVPGLIDGKPVNGMAAPVRAAYSGGVLAAIGDSITQDAVVYPGAVGYTPVCANPVDNWPSVLVPKVAPDTYLTFALGGACFASFPQLSYHQKFENQVTELLAYVAANPAMTPRSLIIALGSNDMHWGLRSAGMPAGYSGLGTYADAMAKALNFAIDGTPTTALDKSITLEAMRLGIARLRFKLATTKFFVSLPLQRAPYTRTQMDPWIDAISKMAGAYGCETIDCYRKSGIVVDFEVDGADGMDLRDGVHPKAPGSKKQGNCLASDVMVALS